MCGIFGYIGRVKEGKEHDLMETMQAIAITSEVRGVDSTGFTAWWDKDKHTTVKEVDRPANFVFKPPMKELFKKGEAPLIFMGHNRMASRGAITYVNAHPFEGDIYSLAHNGTSNGSADALEKKYHLQCQGQTDSERFLSYLEKFPDKLKEMLEQVNNYALSILDKRTGELLLVRDEFRPIFIIDMRDILGVRIYTSTKEIMKDGLELGGWEKIKGVINKGFMPNPFTVYFAKPEPGEFERLFSYPKPKVTYIPTASIAGYLPSWTTASEKDWKRSIGKYYAEQRKHNKKEKVANDENEKKKDYNLIKPPAPQKILDAGVSVHSGDRFKTKEGGVVKVNSFVDSSTVIMLREDSGVCYMESIRMLVDSIRAKLLKPVHN